MVKEPHVLPHGLEVMSATQIKHILKECKAEGLDIVAFAWRIERAGWDRLLIALAASADGKPQGAK